MNTTSKANQLAQAFDKAIDSKAVTLVNDGLAKIKKNADGTYGIDHEVQGWLWDVNVNDCLEFKVDNDYEFTFKDKSDPNVYWTVTILQPKPIFNNEH